VAALVINGIEIWNTSTRKRIKFINFEDYTYTALHRVNSYLFACADYYEGNGEYLSLYDYRQGDSPIYEIDKGYVSTMMVSIDGRHIAYIIDEGRVAVFDTKTLQEVKRIELPDYEEDETDYEGLEIVSKDKLAVYSSRSGVFLYRRFD
jgi:hypothetical protein